MTVELYKEIDLLLEQQKQAVLKIRGYESEIARLKVEIKELEDGRIVLILKLEEANREITRLELLLGRSGGQ